MRAISLWQPWASLWLTPSKIHETRHWATPYRGLLAVHAAQRLVTDPGEEVDNICFHHFGTRWRRTLPRGCVIGIVKLVMCQETSLALSAMHGITCERQLQERNWLGTLPDDYWCGDWTEGRFAWGRSRLDIDTAALRQPIAFKGRQGFFNVSDEVLRG